MAYIVYGQEVVNKTYSDLTGALPLLPIKGNISITPYAVMCPIPL